MKDFKYVIISFTIHLSALAILLMLGGGGGEGEGSGQYPESKQDKVEILPFTGEERVEVSIVEQDGPVTEEPPIPQEKQEEQDSETGYWGIGIRVSMLEALLENRRQIYMTVVEVIAGYPASRAGIREGDKIMAVNGVPVSFEDRIVGEGPASLVLTVERAGQRLYIEVNRDWIRTKGD